MPNRTGTKGLLYRTTALSRARLALDGLSAAAAFSLRKLRTAYNGAAIRVRRSSDNAEMDIPFTANGDLDTAALLAFVGANSGFLTTWYDQSGNGFNLTQIAAPNQPRIVIAGVIENSGGQPAVFTTAGMWMSNAGSFLVAGNGDRTMSAVMSRQAGFGVFFWSGTHAGNQAWGIDSGNLNTFAPYTYGVGDIVSAPVAANTPSVFIATRSSGISYGYVNGSARPVNASAITTVTSPGIGIGRRPDGGESRGWYSELIYFVDALSTPVLQALQQSHGRYYGIAIS